MALRDMLPILALGLLVAVSYLPATQAGFVWDDAILTSSKAVQAWSGLWQMWFSPGSVFDSTALGAGNTAEVHYWPIVYTTFWLEHKLWGFDPAGYHIVNLVLHFVNALLVWVLMLRLSVPGAWFVAAVFAVHPVHVEGVAWLFGRKDLLATLFYLMAVLSYIRFAEEDRQGLVSGRYFLILVLFAAGMLSKSIAVTLPAALLIWHYWKRGRVTGADVYRVLPIFLVGLCIALADWSFYKSNNATTFDYAMSERVLLAARSLCLYAGKLLWPTDLAVYYPRWDTGVTDPLNVAAFVVCLGAVGLLWLLRHRIGRGPLCGVLFFALTLSPVLGLVDNVYMRFSLVADRYQYLAALGVMAAIIGALAHGTRALPPIARRGVQAVALIALVVLGTMTWRQAGIYRDDLTYFSHIISLNPESDSAQGNLGVVLFNAGRLEEAVVAQRNALAIKPNYNAYMHLGQALFLLNRFEEALAATHGAIERRPSSVDAHVRIGDILQRLGRFEEAEKYFRSAIEIDPGNANTRQNLAELLRQQNRYAEAIELYRMVLAANPDFALAHAGMGTALLSLKRHAEAIASLERAVALQPNSPMSRTLLTLMGQTVQALGQADAAARYFERADRIHPRDTD